MHPFLDHMTPSSVITILQAAGPYVRNLNLYGWQYLPEKALYQSLLGQNEGTRLIELDLQGSRDFDEYWLLQLILKSRHLRRISLKGLTGVSNHLVEVIGRTCPHLEYLDVSFCRRISPLRPDTFSDQTCWRNVTQLSIAGCASQGILEDIGRNMPDLQALDVSHSDELTDDDLKSFVAVAAATYEPAYRRLELLRSGQTIPDPSLVFLTPTLAGESGLAFPGTKGMIPRRVTRLRKLSLSECTQLTDDACRYLARAVPDLESFEMAGIGDGLADGGLLALLPTCPRLKRLDLDSAYEITDAVVRCLIPSPKFDMDGHARNSEVGDELEMLRLGFAITLTNDALLALVRGCPKLMRLNADVRTSSLKRLAVKLAKLNPSRRTLL